MRLRPAACIVFLPAAALAATSWQWQLSGAVDQSVSAAVFDIDLFENDAGVVAALHAKGRRAICYFSAGSWENGRPDGDRFPAAVRGRQLKGWPNERWLDIRRLDILGPAMEARLDLCKAKGFDGAEPDNVDAFQSATGFPLTAADQLRYNIFLAAAAHQRGLTVALKNDLDQVNDLVAHFDFALNEQCFEYKECAKLLPFIRAGKPVFQVEYKLRTSQFCAEANRLNFDSMRKHLKLDAFREPCR